MVTRYNNHCHQSRLVSPRTFDRVYGAQLAASTIEWKLACLSTRRQRKRLRVSARADYRATEKADRPARITSNVRDVLTVRLVKKKKERKKGKGKKGRERKKEGKKSAERKEKGEKRGLPANASMKCPVPRYLLYLLRCNYAAPHIARRGKTYIVDRSCGSARARLHHSHYRSVDVRGSTVICAVIEKIYKPIILFQTLLRRIKVGVEGKFLA